MDEERLKHESESWRSDRIHETACTMGGRLGMLHGNMIVIMLKYELSPRSAIAGAPSLSPPH